MEEREREKKGEGAMLVERARAIIAERGNARGGATMFLRADREGDIDRGLVRSGRGKDRKREREGERRKTERKRERARGGERARPRKRETRGGERRAAASRMRRDRQRVREVGHVERVGWRREVAYGEEKAPRGRVFDRRAREESQDGERSPCDRRRRGV